MDASEKAGYDRSQCLMGFAILAAALLLGAAAYFGAMSAKETMDKLDSAIGNVGADGMQGVKEAAKPAANNTAAQGNMADGKDAGAAQGQGGTDAQQGGAAGRPSAQQNGTATHQQVGSAQKEVVIDFLYASWCPHCQNMKTVMAGLERAFPAERFEVHYWDYEKQKEDEVGAIYQLYTGKGYFKGGVPMFVANGNDSRVGEMPEATFKAWICSKFSDPKPEGC
jgi:thiol-disulfide isomerase/thioredoxin